MDSSFTRRTIVRGSAWAAPTVLASAVIPAYAVSYVPCEPNTTVPVAANTSTDGSKKIVTITIPRDVPAFSFDITGGAGGSYEGAATIDPGTGGKGARVTGKIAVKQGDTITFVIAGGGAYDPTRPITPGRGWADGGEHTPAATDAETNRFKAKPVKTFNESYSATGGGASAIFRNNELIAVAGGGGGAGTRYINSTTWRPINTTPSDYRTMRGYDSATAHGGNGGAANPDGGSYSETYPDYPGPSLLVHGGKAGSQGVGGTSGPRGGLQNPASNRYTKFTADSEHQIFSELVNGESGQNAVITSSPTASGGGSGGKSVIGRAFVSDMLWTDSEYLAFGSVLHSATGGGGYGGGASGSISTSAGYATEKRWQALANRRGWYPIGVASISGGGGAGGSYLSYEVLEGEISESPVKITQRRLNRTNGTASAQWCTIRTTKG